MKINPSMVVADLEQYIGLYNISLSEEARKTIGDIEEFAYKCDNPTRHNLFFSKIIYNSEKIRDIIINEGNDPKLIAFVLERDYYKEIDEVAGYEDDLYSYSQVNNRKLIEKASIIDGALEYCIRDKRNELDNIDIFLATMDDYEKTLEEDNSYWVDKRLNTIYTTFSHVSGYYDDDLEVRFDRIREGLLNERKEIISIV